MKYYKITNETEIHNGLKYKAGLNVDPLPFNPSGDCLPGGIYYTDAKNICYFLGCGPWIREVTLPKDAQVYQNPGIPLKWKADKVKLGPRKKWCSVEVIKKLIKEGTDIHAGYDCTLRLASYNGHLSAVKYLVKIGADIHVIHVCEDSPLRLASDRGHLNVVKYLVEQGADIHADNDCALRMASNYGHLSVVKYLVKNGADIHADNDCALRLASGNNHQNVVKFLKGKLNEDQKRICEQQ